MSAYLKQALISLVVSVLVVTTYHFFIFEKKVPKVKFFDLTGYVSVLQSAYLAGKMSDSEVSEILKDMRALLDKESKQGNVIILPKAIVINNDLRGDAEIQYQNPKLKEAVASLLQSMGTNSTIGPQIPLSK